MDRSKFWKRLWTLSQAAPIDSASRGNSRVFAPPLPDKIDPALCVTDSKKRDMFLRYDYWSCPHDRELEFGFIAQVANGYSALESALDTEFHNAQKV